METQVIVIKLGVKSELIESILYFGLEDDLIELRKINQSNNYFLDDRLKFMWRGFRCVNLQ